MKFSYTFALILFAQICFSQKTISELKGIEDKIDNLIKQYGRQTNKRRVKPNARLFRI